ncbi:MAG: hypothetical protein HOV66_19770 [Streptomycetaceae bacterium]|nr:hypothetical protein [Streptomycetaceae bacterium]
MTHTTDACANAETPTPGPSLLTYAATDAADIGRIHEQSLRAAVEVAAATAVEQAATQTVEYVIDPPVVFSSRAGTLLRIDAARVTRIRNADGSEAHVAVRVQGIDTDGQPLASHPVMWSDGLARFDLGLDLPAEFAELFAPASWPWLASGEADGCAAESVAGDVAAEDTEDEDAEDERGSVTITTDDGSITINGNLYVIADAFPREDGVRVVSGDIHINGTLGEADVAAGLSPTLCCRA